MKDRFNLSEIFEDTSHRYMTYGERIFKKMTEHKDKQIGATVGLFIGEQGAGKTTALLYLAEKFINNGEIVIWKGSTREQIYKLPDWQEKTIFWHHELDELECIVYIGNTKSNITDKINVKTYKNSKDLIRNLKKGVINVVYQPTIFKFSKDSELTKYLIEARAMKVRNLKQFEFKLFNYVHPPIYFWFELMNYLIYKDNNDWYALLIDEIDEIFPAVVRDIWWDLMDFAKDHVRHMRKALVSLFGTTHAYTEINDKVKNKFQYRCWMRGAKIPKYSIIQKDATYYLRRGQMIIDSADGYGRYQIPKYEPTPIESMIVVVNRTVEESEELEELEEDPKQII